MSEAAAATPALVATPNAEPPSPAPPPVASPSAMSADAGEAPHRLGHMDRVRKAIEKAAEARGTEPASPPAPEGAPAAGGATSAPAKSSLDEKMAKFREDRGARAKLSAEVARKEADLARFRGLDEIAAKGDPAEILRFFGKDPQALLEAQIVRAMKEGATATDPVAEQIAAELGPLRQELDRFRTEAQQREQQREHAVAFERYVTQEVIPAVSDAEKLEALYLYHSDAQGRTDVRRIAAVVADARAKLYQKTGELLTAAEVAEWLTRDYEELLVAGYEKTSKLKKLAARAAAAPPPQHGKEPRTLIGNARRDPEPSGSGNVERPRRLGHEEKKAAAIARAHAARAR